LALTDERYTAAWLRQLCARQFADTTTYQLSTMSAY